MLSRKLLLTVGSIAVVLIVIGSVIYIERPETVPITVHSRPAVSYVSGNFLLSDYFGPIVGNPENLSTTTYINESGGSCSILTLRVNIIFGCYLPYDGPSFNLNFNSSIIAVISPNLHPSGFEFIVRDLNPGGSNNSSAEPFNFVYMYPYFLVNTSLDPVINLPPYTQWIVPVSLHNEPAKPLFGNYPSQKYHFAYFAAWGHIFFEKFTGTHVFQITAKLLGLEKNVTASVDIYAVDQ